MAKASINTGADAQPVHTRTTAGAEESQVVVLGTDGSDAVLDPASLATQATLAALLTAATGPDTVYRGTSTATIDLAAGERLHSVLVFPTASGQVTVTAPGQPADQCPVDLPYAEDFKGGLGGPSDLVIAGAVAYYRVTTYTP